MASSHGGAQGVAVQRGTGQQFPPCALAVTADDIRLSVKVHQAVNRNHCRFHDCIIVGMLFANALTCVRAKLVQHQMVRCIDAGNTFSAVSTKHADIRPNVCCIAASDTVTRLANPFRVFYNGSRCYLRSMWCEVHVRQLTACAFQVMMAVGEISVFRVGGVPEQLMKNSPEVAVPHDGPPHDELSQNIDTAEHHSDITNADYQQAGMASVSTAEPRLPGCSPSTKLSHAGMPAAAPSAFQRWELLIGDRPSSASQVRQYRSFD